MVDEEERGEGRGEGRLVKVEGFGEAVDAIDGG